MAIPKDKIEDVRERTNIVEVVRRHVELKRAGTGSWKGLCPFHAEKTASFHVHEQRQFFHCFGCGEKGDVFTFLTKIEQRSFMEVLRDLAGQAGIDLPEKPMSPAEKRALADAESERERMLRTMELAVAFFEEQLATPGGAAARAYLEKRGISQAVVERFRVGYAPAGWEALQKHLAARQVPTTVAEALGLVGVNERGRYDFFRDRVMLPVFDRQGRAIGFSSRLLDPEAKDRKYVNSPDSPLFHKRQALYGLHVAQEAIRRGGEAVVVEGNFDVLSLHEAGIANVVAPMGTALTREHASLLGRMARRVVVVFDGDEAGERAARKALPVFLEVDVDGYVAKLPAGVDPDDFVRKEGAETFRKLCANARPMVEQSIDDAARVAEDSVPGRLRATEELAPVLAAVRNQTARELYMSRAAAALGLSPQQMARAVRQAAAAARAAARPIEGAAGVSDGPAARRDPPKEELDALALMASHPELARLPEARRVRDLLTDPGIRQIFRTALDALEQGERPDVPAWLDAGPADVRDAVAAALLDGRFAGVDSAERALKALRLRFERAQLEREIADKARAAREARARGDEETARSISLQEMELIKTKQGLQEALSRP